MMHLGKSVALMVTFLVALGTMSPAEAFLGKCLLAVDGKTYVKGICRIDRTVGGSFSIGTGMRTRAKYFAYVSVEPSGQAQGYWNGVEAESHAHDSLGVLMRQGACWVNERAKICGFR
ncbi:MAG: hypothetical protein QOF14_5647 [Hyphomicrobiales bacterium]|jgi:hypothetical protein|nr:hypothetical protein [Hyphomicrobiales bacterium]